MNLLTSIIIVYDSWFGNTQVVAETIGNGIKEIEKGLSLLKKINNAKSSDVLNYDIYWFSKSYRWSH